VKNNHEKEKYNAINLKFKKTKERSFFDDDISALLASRLFVAPGGTRRLNSVPYDHLSLVT